LAPCWATSSSSRRASSIWFCISFSAIARSRSTASARRSKVARFRLDLLPGRRLQRTLEIVLGPHRHHPNVSDHHPALGQAGVADQRVGNPLPHQLDARIQHLLHTQRADEGEGRLLAQLGQDSADPLQRGGVPATGPGVYAEVDPGGGKDRVREAVGDGGLNRHVLEVTGSGVKQKGLFLVGDGDLAERARQRLEPESQTRTLALGEAFVQVNDVGGGLGPQVADERQVLDLGHVGLLFRMFSSLRR
jgi:hypothetical protein